jgi:hypothetical protein
MRGRKEDRQEEGRGKGRRKRGNARKVGEEYLGKEARGK